MNYLNNNYLVERLNVETNMRNAGVVEVQAVQQDQSEYRNRVLNLFGEFNKQTIGDMMRQCLKWEEEDAEILYKHAQQIRQVADPRQLLKPIILNINSPGGHVDELFALVDMLESMPAPVITRAYGEIASCGFVLFCVGDERYVGPNVSLMYHEIWYGICGKDSEVKNYHLNSKKVQKRIDRLIKAKTGISLKQLDEWKKANQDKWLDAKEAVDLGIATDLLY